VFFDGEYIGAAFNRFFFVIAWQLPDDGSAFFTDYGIPTIAVIHRGWFMNEFVTLAFRAFRHNSLHA
jgi:hypothetical protein